MKSKSQGGSGNQVFCTPRWFLNVLLDKVLTLFFFDLDPCCSGPSDACGKQWFTPQEDGLKKPWFRHVFVNPPWKYILAWAFKAENEIYSCDSITFLLPFKPETKWFNKLYLLHPDIYIVRPRLNYYDPIKRKIVSGIAYTSCVIHLRKKYMTERTEAKWMFLDAKRPKDATR